MEEPHRRSFLDVLKRNLSLADRFALSTRFVYIGGYSGSDVDLQKRMKDSVKELTEEYGETAMTGLLIVYPKYFIHIVEASEESIYRHLRFILDENSNEMLGRLVQLSSYYNVYRMYFSGWYTTVVKSPPVFLDKIEKTELDEIERQIKNCLFKLYSLCEYLFFEPPQTSSSSTTDVVSKKFQPEKMKDMLKSLDKHVLHYLPEATILEYLLTVKSGVLDDVRDHIIRYEQTPYLNFYNGNYYFPLVLREIQGIQGLLDNKCKNSHIE